MRIAMNVYDTANNLAQEIKQSSEYREYAEAKSKIANNPDKNIKLKEFEQLRYETQVAAMQGQEIDEEKTKKLQQKYSKLIEDEEIKKYFETEIKFNVMMADVNKILAEAVKDVI